MRTRIKFILFVLLSGVAITFGSIEARAEVSVQVGTPNFRFSLNDYQPAPPNVHIYNDGGRPYYIERDKRVYMEKKAKKYKKNKYKNKGHKNGNGKH